MEGPVNAFLDKLGDQCVFASNAEPQRVGNMAYLMKHFDIPTSDGYTGMVMCTSDEGRTATYFFRGNQIGAFLVNACYRNDNEKWGPVPLPNDVPRDKTEMTVAFVTTLAVRNNKGELVCSSETVAQDPLGTLKKWVSQDMQNYGPDVTSSQDMQNYGPNKNLSLWQFAKSVYENPHSGVKSLNGVGVKPLNNAREGVTYGRAQNSNTQPERSNGIQPEWTTPLSATGWLTPESTRSAPVVDLRYQLPSLTGNVAPESIGYTLSPGGS
jgi:hypothetical protein